MSVQVGGGVRGEDGSDISDGSDRVGRVRRCIFRRRGIEEKGILEKGVGYLAEKL